jgi:tRNA(Ile)-lysidine synthase TilS/MesJ
MKVCSRCIYNEGVSGISFDSFGVCSYCRQIEEIEQVFKTGLPDGCNEFQRIVSEIKLRGSKLNYDIIVGVSGGTDSSYLLHLAVKNGLRPLAVHYDNTWNTAIATMNINKITKKLNVDLETYVIDNKEQDDILLAFMRAGICGVDAATDLALAEVMYRAASRHGVRYVFEGHSFRAEGVSPIGNSYTDGKFIKSVVKMHSNRILKTYPNMTFFRFLRWVLFLRIKKIRPLWYLNYNKTIARELLEKEYDWKYYEGHHLENRIAAFDHSFLMPTKYSVDQRNNSLAAEARHGTVSRDNAIIEYSKPPKVDPDLIDYVKKRLELNDVEFEEIMRGPIRSYRDYPSYKKRFERFRPLFKILAKANLVPLSFYLKYCFPAKDLK